MKDFGRFLLTLFIWAIIGAIGISSFIDEGITSGGVILVVILLSFGTGLTNILMGQGSSSSSKADETAMMEKPKRTGADVDKTELLLSMMDDDERAAFKAALQQRILDSTARLSDDVRSDGEVDIETLEELLQNERRD